MRTILAALIALGVLAMPLAGPVSASSPPVPGTTGFGAPAPSFGPSTALAPASDTGPLSSLAAFTVRGGYVAAGIGMRNRGDGTITLAGIPAGAHVSAAYLFWDVLADTAGPDFALGTFAGQPIDGTFIGSGGNPCWGNAANFAYRADVTSLVTGNGDYALAGFASHLTDGQDPWNQYDNTPPLMEGASLVAIYEDASAPATQVLLYDGAAGDAYTTLSQTFSGFTAVAPVQAQTTFIVGDGQAVAQNPPTFDGAPLPGAVLDGSDSQAGPAYSQNDLWDTRTVDVSSLLTPGATSAVATIDGTSDCHVWVAQVLAVSSASELPVLFVHGYGANADSNNWINAGGFINTVQAHLGETVLHFTYVQDASYSTNNVCTPLPAELPQTPDGGMPYNAASATRIACDSDSDIGLNAVALETTVRTIYEQTHQKVVLVANSMGGAIVRGFFAYSSERDDGVAASMVDSTFYVEGAQQGAGVLSPATPLNFALQQGLVAQLEASGWAPGGPAGPELIPQSAWYKWTNPAPAHVPQVPAFNAYGDISLVSQSCFFSFCWNVPVVPYGIVGDGILMPGSDDPLATPATGGARYLNGAAGAQNWEWDVRDAVNWNPGLILALPAPLRQGAEIYAAASAILGSPASHLNMGTKMSQTHVPDCQNPKTTTLDAELRALIEGRVDGQPYLCHT